MDPCYGSLKLELQTFTWPWVPVPSNATEDDSVTLEDVSSREDVLPNANERSLPSEEDVADFKPSGSADGPEQQEEDIDLNEAWWNDPAKLPEQAGYGKVGLVRMVMETFMYLMNARNYLSEKVGTKHWYQTMKLRNLEKVAKERR
ncbi:hypothetical protein MHU86_1869 [Fragilaria crotonensis]|nr:hypothetical protein MHU86_1869 [Fragilaria crotonensis]